jgi:hypothetical protein
MYEKQGVIDLVVYIFRKGSLTISLIENPPQYRAAYIDYSTSLGVSGVHVNSYLVNEGAIIKISTLHVDVQFMFRRIPSCRTFQGF